MRPLKESELTSEDFDAGGNRIRLRYSEREALRIAREYEPETPPEVWLRARLIEVLERQGRFRAATSTPTNPLGRL